MKDTGGGRVQRLYEDESIHAKEFLKGKITRLPEPYLIIREAPLVSVNASGITYDNIAAAINILAQKHNYKILSTGFDNRTMYVFMEKNGKFAIKV